MKSNKVTLVLTEIIIVIFILAVSSAACLRVFADASEKTKLGENMRLSAIAAQNAAECWTSTDGDMAKLPSILEKATIDFELISSSDASVEYLDGAYKVTVTAGDKSPYTASATVDVYLQDKEDVFFSIEAHSVIGIGNGGSENE